MPNRKYITNFGLSLLSFVLSVVIADFTAGEVLRRRLKQLVSDWTTDQYSNAHAYQKHFQYDPIYGFTLKPNINDPGVTHSKYGIRGKLGNFEKSSAVERILFAGDSQVYGWSVSDEQTISAYFQAYATKNFKRGVESINLGVTSYSIDQSFLRFIAEGIAFKPDQVVFMLFPENDILDTVSAHTNGLPKSVFWLDDDKNLRYGNIPVPWSLGWDVNPLKQKSYSLPPSNLIKLLFTFTGNISGAGCCTETNEISFLKRYLRIKHFLGTQTTVPSNLKGGYENGLILASEILSRWNTICNNLQMTFTVVLKPREEDLMNRQASQIHGELFNALTSKGIDTLDPLMQMIEIEPTSTALLHGDYHLSPVGNKILAEIIFKKLYPN